MTALSAAHAAEATSLLAAKPISDASNWQPTAINTDVPFFDTDWSLGLRGSYINSSTEGGHYQGLLLPAVTFTHTGSTLSITGGADAQISKTDDGGANVDAMRLSAGSALQFTPDTSLTTNASLSKTQEDVLAPDVATNIAATPVTYTGSADATLTQKFGRFNLSAGVTAGRSVYGSTTFTDASVEDNTGQNNTSGGGNLRLGFALTPVFEVFTKVDATRTVFDAPVPALATKLDGIIYTARSGVVGTWGDVLTASASIGAAYEHFDDTSLADVRATLYDASFSYKPSSTLTVSGDFSTTVGAPSPTGSGTAQIEYTATGSALYTVNDWLDWRGSAGWNSATYADSSATSSGYSFGAGADYLLNRHTKVSADYNFAHADSTSSVPTDAHTVSVGLTLQK